jgi:ribosomal protein L32E
MSNKKLFADTQNSACYKKEPLLQKEENTHGTFNKKRKHGKGKKVNTQYKTNKEFTGLKPDSELGICG